ncbi:MAG TPA: phosphonate metabolism transcriptional regulator PhnF [Mesorhizobium sp.]|nr:phosphonate metabolism transcriptional regulator PhnF [Mesorhizobium sp.]
MQQPARLQRGVGVALWRQIADRIRSGIASGLADGQGRLPPESELALRFGVNRHTVRAAISALAYEGVLYSEQGRGTYVRGPNRLVYPISDRTRFSAGLVGQAREVRGRLLSHAREPASQAVAAALGLPAGAATVRIEVLGSADGAPVSRATSWFGADRFPDIADVYSQTGSVTQALARAGVADYRRVSTTVEARHADEAETDDLKLMPGAIVLVTRAVNADLEGVPVQYSLTRFPADRVELLLET